MQTGIDVYSQQLSRPKSPVPGVEAKSDKGRQCARANTCSPLPEPRVSHPCLWCCACGGWVGVPRQISAPRDEPGGTQPHQQGPPRKAHKIREDSNTHSTWHGKLVHNVGARQLKHEDLLYNYPNISTASTKSPQALHPVYI